MLTAILLVAAGIVLSVGKAQDIAFPDQAQIAPAGGGREPLYVPGKCPENQLLYPGVQKDDWVCDCGQGHIYYPKTNACYPAYRQGPCTKGEYLILPKNEIIPACRSNPCKVDGQVRYRNICHRLNKPDGPCPPVNAGGGILGVNASTIELGCLHTSDNVLSIISVPPNGCPPGSKRSANGCRVET